MSIAPDNTISIICPTAEMGQDVYTSLPLILAEELDADWSKVRTEFAPANPKVYGNKHRLFDGAQTTAASVSVPGYFMPPHLAGRGDSGNDPVEYHQETGQVDPDA